MTRLQEKAEELLLPFVMHNIDGDATVADAWDIIEDIASTLSDRIIDEGPTLNLKEKK